MTWAAGVVCALVMKYHWAGFDASLLCYFIQLDIGQKLNKEFENGVKDYLENNIDSELESFRAGHHEGEMGRVDSSFGESYHEDEEEKFEDQNNLDGADGEEGHGDDLDLEENNINPSRFEEPDINRGAMEEEKEEENSDGDNGNTNPNPALIQGHNILSPDN